MRLLHCIHSLDPRGGGPADFVRQLGALQASHNFEIEVLCLDAANSEWLADFPATVHAVGPGAGGYGYTPRFVQWLHENAARFDAVVVDGVWQFPSFGTWLALRNSTTPYFVFPHGMLDPWFNEAYPSKRLKKEVYWALCEYRSLRDARAVLFTSATEQERAATAFAPYKVNSATVNYGTIPPPLDLESHRSSFQSKFQLGESGKVLAYLGRIHPKKGCDILIEAFKVVSKAHPEAQLLLAGPGTREYLEEIDYRIRSAPKVTRIDMIAGAEKWGMLSSAQALVLPSHQENFARVVSEALSCSTPVLLSDKVNICNEVRDDGAGMVAPDTLAGTTSMLAKFLDLPSGEVQKMKVNAQLCYQKRFDLDKNVSDYIELIAAHLS